MAISRRIFLRNSAIAMAGVGSAPLWLQRAAFAAEQQSRSKKVLVAIFQRGAADGLNIVVPHAEQRYYDLRPTISIPRPSSNINPADAAVDLDGFFGLHPSLVALQPLWQQQRLAIVHAAGSPDPTRSHFDAQDYMESGTPGLKATTDGWLNRALPAASGQVSPVRAVSLGPSLARTIRGSNSAIAVENLNNFTVRDSGASKVLQAMYTGTSDQILGGTGRETFDAVALLQTIQKTPYQPAAGANYPRGRFGDSMRQIAQLIKADVGVEVAFADIGNWDHHVNEVGPKASVGQLANVLSDFGNSLAAFYQDLGDRVEDVVVVTMSEFGRTAKENGNRGTDHGHANVMFVMGGPVQGGKVYGKWPGLAPEQLNEERDLALTTDFRDVLGEAVYTHLGNRSIQSVFPNYSGSADKFRGFLRSG
ncbi:MAG TPA: DUF1501 domain-containing protein [Bryobacteraceae bacterium]|jgi:uncharacterized protein (DUF1501 family)|nr:DUF1501 domain-containing protein [Bryobacteraceae bacterium]